MRFTTRVTPERSESNMWLNEERGADSFEIDDNDTALKRVIVVGGGAAGLMAAVVCAERGADVRLFEKNERTANKLRITGKGRCNVTNDCDNAEFMRNVPTNPRFLYTVLSRFSTADTKDFFEEFGVPLKVERGKRVFPVSDKASDISGALEKRCAELGVRILHRRVSSIKASNGVIEGVVAGGKDYYADAVILATGGRSYPKTGSDGDGYRFAEKLGHTIIPPMPSLVPIVCGESTDAFGKAFYLCRELQGLSLKNVALRIVECQSGKAVYDDFGEMLFTHFGVSGPMILSASAHLRDVVPGKYEIQIDLKPALDGRTLDARVLSDFSKSINRDFENSLSALLPKKMIPVIVRLSGIDPYKKVNSITKEERAQLVSLLKCLKVFPTGLRPIDEAIITRGGVNVKEINPKTMGSLIVKGLYFAGEIIDVDAYTGGFNLQIAFSTAFVAGESAAYD